MADSILTPGYQEEIPQDPISEETTQYLEKDKYLSEYQQDNEKSIVRNNLGVPSKDNVYTKEDTDTKISQAVREGLQGLLSMEDPYGIIPQVEEMIKDFVKNDGSTPFNLPQIGTDPISSNHLTTKNYVDKQLANHIVDEDPHGTMTLVRALLTQYVKNTDVYDKQSVYTKGEVNNTLRDYVKRDGTTPFTKAQVGIDPELDSHLATKRYTDKILYNHIIDVDPHGFLEILSSRLANYAKKKDVYDKTQTYSRTQIDSVINQRINSILDLSIKDYIDSINSRLEYIRQHYIRQDGTIPFTSPQPGVDAINDSDLVTYRQLKGIDTGIREHLVDLECVWKTSGPVESTVGHVEDNTQLPDIMTLQDVCDAIFYGRTISLTVPEYVTVTKTGEITMCVHGAVGMIDYAELYQNGKVIYTFTSTDFDEGCITVDSLPITEDTEFTFKVYYNNGTMNQDTGITKCGFPIFIGLLPKWKFANTVTMEYLNELQDQYTEGTQNRFVDYGDDVKSITFKYQFQDSELRHPFVVVPKAYPDLEGIVTKSQSFGIEAFDVINEIPLQIEGVSTDTIYKIYVYRQALSSLNQEVTFNFIKE